MSLVKAVEQMEDEIANLKQERDEAVALVEVMRVELEKYRGQINQYGKCTASDALSITGPDALREIQARTLDTGKSEIDKLRIAHDPRMAVPGEQYYARASAVLHDMAAAKRNGE